MLLWPSNSSLTYTSEVMDPDITTISPVNKLHPQDDILATGSSRQAYRCISAQYHYPVLDLFFPSHNSQDGPCRSIFIWKPKIEDEFTEERTKQKAKEYVYGSGSGRNQMTSLTIVVMTTQMAILAERTRKQRRLVSLTPQKEKANPKSDTWCTSCFSNFDKKSATYQPLLNLRFIFCTILSPS